MLLTLGRWGAASLGAPKPEESLRSGWIGVAMRAYSVPEASAGIQASIELRLEDTTLHLRLDDGVITIGNGSVEDPSLLVEVDNLPLLGLLNRAVTADELIRSDALRLEGDKRLIGVLTDVVRFPGAIEQESVAGRSG